CLSHETPGWPPDRVVDRRGAKGKGPLPWSAAFAARRPWSHWSPPRKAGGIPPDRAGATLENARPARLGRYPVPFCRFDRVPPLAVWQTRTPPSRVGTPEWVQIRDRALKPYLLASALEY